jgi:hypothetical protein
MTDYTILNSKNKNETLLKAALYASHYEEESHGTRQFLSKILP